MAEVCFAESQQPLQRPPCLSLWAGHRRFEQSSWVHLTRSAVIRSRASPTFSNRSGFGKQFFRVTTLAALISNPGRRDFGSAVTEFALQLRDLGWGDRFAHDGIAGRTFLHHYWDADSARTVASDGAGHRLKSGKCALTGRLRAIQKFSTIQALLSPAVGISKIPCRPSGD